ncbi:MAG: urease subunit alpha, partial [Nitrosopumilus sp.]|nr:urease subunit alpha [Nitrosopumilus sp.]
MRIPRRTYADLYGPTTGDRVRLADTEIIIEVERDLLRHGDEVVFGGGKSARDGMGQASGVPRAGSLDMVVTNAIVMDPVLGIIKADIGVKDGLIAGVGNAGNPDTMDGIEMVVSSNTEVVSGENAICTPG